jgi:hypothetical protein
MQFLVLLAILLLPVLALTGCATAEMDADDAADTAIKGLEGQGTLSTDKPTKDTFGSEYQ